MSRSRPAASKRSPSLVWLRAAVVVPLLLAGANQCGQPATLEAGDSVVPSAVEIDASWLEERAMGRGGSAVELPEGEPGNPTQPPPPRVPILDPMVQIQALLPGGGAAFEMTGPDVNVAGLTGFARPPDTVGDVGPNHYIQMVNPTFFQVFNKDGTPATGPTAGPLSLATLWPAGDLCASDFTDPIVVYDHLADRWLLSQLVNPTHVCIAISQTPDPTNGLWYTYTFNTDRFSTGAFPDYQKFGVWPDGYYMSSYEGSNLGVYVFDRDNMLNGFAAAYLKGTLPSLGAAGVRNTRILPADLDGPPPPVGTPNFFVRTVDGQQDPGNPVDRIEIYELSVNWPALSGSFGLVQTLGPFSFNTMLCDRSGAAGTQAFRDCIPQPDTAQNLDALSNRPMMQLKYRNFAGQGAMVFNQTIDVSGSMSLLTGITPANEVAGIRWYELQGPAGGGAWTIGQQGTYAPQPLGAAAEDELQHRWMGSIAMDKDRNMALGYSVTNDDDTNGQEVYPGIRYTGRSKDDSPGRMSQGEKVVLNGVRSQTDSFRWGDYSAMSVDPVDDCTFWFTSQVAPPAGLGGPTQIASFVFETCNSTDLAIFKSANPDPALAGGEVYYDISVVNFGSENTATDVVVVDDLPAGVGYVTDTGGCVEGPVGTLTCEVGDLGPGESAQFTIKGMIAADLVAMSGGPVGIVNEASVEGHQADPVPNNNTDTAGVIVEELADLRVTKLCKPDRELLAGQIGTCTVFIDNFGPSMARDVVAMDALVSDGTFTIVGTPTPSQGMCMAWATTWACMLGDLEPATASDEGRATIEVVLTSDEQVDINDLSRAVSNTPDPDTGNNESQGSIAVSAVADLSISKSDSPDPVEAGTQLSYTLDIANAGPSTAVNVVVADVVPAGVTIDSVSGSGGASCNAGVPGDASQPTTCNFGSLAAGAMRTMTIVVTVLPGTRGQLLNDARVSSDTLDVDNSNDLASATTTVLAVADLSVTKTDFPDPVYWHDILTYEITVANAGPSTAEDVVVTDFLPEEVAFVQATFLTGSGSCLHVEQPPPERLVCDVDDLEPGDSATILVDVKVKVKPWQSAIVIENEVTVETSATDPNPANDSDTEDTTVKKNHFHY